MANNNNNGNSGGGNPGTPGCPKKAKREEITSRFAQDSRSRIVVSITLPKELVRDVDRFVVRNKISSRSQLVEDLLRDEVYPDA